MEIKGLLKKVVEVRTEDVVVETEYQDGEFSHEVESERVSLTDEEVGELKDRNNNSFGIMGYEVMNNYGIRKKYPFVEIHFLGKIRRGYALRSKDKKFI